MRDGGGYVRPTVEAEAGQVVMGGRGGIVDGDVVAQEEETGEVE